MKDRDNMIPVSFRRNETERVQTVYGKEYPTKRCSCCRMELKTKLEYYQTRDHEADYTRCVLCYDLIKKYSEEWKDSKKLIIEELRKNHIDHFETRKKVFELIFKHRGKINLLEEVC